MTFSVFRWNVILNYEQVPVSTIKFTGVPHYEELRRHSINKHYAPSSEKSRYYIRSRKYKKSRHDHLWIILVARFSSQWSHLEPDPRGWDPLWFSSALSHLLFIHSSPQSTPAALCQLWPPSSHLLVISSSTQSGNSTQSFSLCWNFFVNTVIQVSLSSTNLFHPFLSVQFDQPICTQACQQFTAINFYALPSSPSLGSFENLTASLNCGCCGGCCCVSVLALWQASDLSGSNPPRLRPLVSWIGSSTLGDGFADNNLGSQGD